MRGEMGPCPHRSSPLADSRLDCPICKNDLILLPGERVSHDRGGVAPLAALDEKTREREDVKTRRSRRLFGEASH